MKDIKLILNQFNSGRNPNIDPLTEDEKANVVHYYGTILALPHEFFSDKEKSEFDPETMNMFQKTVSEFEIYHKEKVKTHKDEYTFVLSRYDDLITRKYISKKVFKLTDKEEKAFIKRYIARGRNINSYDDYYYESTWLEYCSEFADELHERVINYWNDKLYKFLMSKFKKDITRVDWAFEQVKKD
jgi:hypothetical protein